MKHRLPMVSTCHSSFILHPSSFLCSLRLPCSVVLLDVAVGRRLSSDVANRRSAGRQSRSPQIRNPQSPISWLLAPGRCFAAMRRPPASPAAACPRNSNCSGPSRPPRAGSSRRPPSSMAWSTSAAPTASSTRSIWPTARSAGSSPRRLGFNASAAVRGGRVYIGDVDGVFYCLDAATGKKLWKFQTDGEIDSSANFHDDHVLFGSQDTLSLLPGRRLGQARLEVSEPGPDPLLSHRGRTISASWPAATGICT